MPSRIRMGEAHAIQRPMRSKAVGSAVTTGAFTFSWASRSVTEEAVPWASRGLPSSRRAAASLPVRVRSAPFFQFDGAELLFLVGRDHHGFYHFRAVTLFVTTERVKAQKALSAFLRMTGSISSPDEVMMPAAPMDETGAM